MLVKVCPKCKAENKPTNAACSICYTSLESVAETESAAPAPVMAQAASAAPKSAQPPAGGALPTQQMPASQQTQMGTMGPPPGMPIRNQMMPPVKRKSLAGIIALVVFLVILVFGGFGYMTWMMLKPEPIPTAPPEQTVLKYLAQKRTRVLSKVEPYLSQHSIEMIHRTYSSRQFESAGYGKADAANIYIFDAEPTIEQMEEKQILASVIKDDKFTDERTVVVRAVVDEKPEQAAAPQPLLPPGVTPPEPEPRQSLDLSSLFKRGPIETDFVLVAEKGQWKIDITKTSLRTLGVGKLGYPFKMGK